MGLDIRIPIGLLFTIVGGLLALFGVLGSKAIYARSLGMNVNLIWGAVLLLVGILFVVAGMRGKAESPAKAAAERQH